MFPSRSPVAAQALEVPRGLTPEAALPVFIAGLGLDLRLETPGPLRVGDTLRAQLLRFARSENPRSAGGHVPAASAVQA